MNALVTHQESGLAKIVAGDGNRARGKGGGMIHFFRFTFDYDFFLWLIAAVGTVGKSFYMDCIAYVHCGSPWVHHISKVPGII